MGKHTKAQTVFDRYDRIFIDTSSVMNFKELKMFLEKYGDRIRKSRTQIVMPKAVQIEIARHLGSSREDKAEKSTECLTVLADYPGLIVCDGCINPEDLMYDTHADREILAMLISGNGRYKQLLITNDNGLSMDAVNLNSLHSCSGKTISVKSINKKGELRLFKAKRQPELSAADESKSPSVIWVKKEEHVNKADITGRDFLYSPETPAASFTVPSEEACQKSASAGVPMPLFILGMVGAGLLGTFFGVAAVHTQYLPREGSWSAA